MIVPISGPPASGKSSLATRLAFQLKAEIVHFDDMIPYCTTDGQYKHHRTKIYQYVQDLVKRDIDVILDDCFQFNSMWRPYYNMARQYQTNFCRIVLKTPVSACLERNAKRLDPVNENVILRMAPYFDDILKQEGCIVSLDGKVALEMIVENAIIPKQHQPLLTQPQEQPWQHNVNLELNRIVGKLIQSGLYNPQDVLQAKKLLFKDIKNTCQTEDLETSLINLINRKT